MKLCAEAREVFDRISTRADYDDLDGAAREAAGRPGGTFNRAHAHASRAKAARLLSRHIETCRMCSP